MNFLNSIAARLILNVMLALTALVVVAYGMGQIAVERTWQGAVAGMQSATEIAETFLAGLDARVQAGELTLEEAQTLATASLNSMRWGVSGYLFSVDDEVRWTAHAILSDRMGEDASGILDQQGTAVLAAVAELGQAGGGQLSYYWLNPATDEVEAKVSYVTYFEPWGWSIGTGLYESEINHADGLLWRRVTLMAAGTAALLLLVTGLTTFSIVRPISGLVARIRRLTAGDLEGEVAQRVRRDEIGSIAKSVDQFRIAQIEDGRAKLMVSEEMAGKAAAQTAMVSQLSTAMGDVSNGDLTVRLNEPFAPEFETVRQRFNDTMQSLEGLVDAVGGTALAVQDRSGDIQKSAESVSNQGQSNAASLQEAAAAIEELANAVTQTSDSATELDRILLNVDGRATQSREVVTEATNAMQRIEASSGQISKIIDVIGDIAFQTNLLALNAGVEAARAGSAGSGFAVVATEVRGLASRTSEAATQIAELIRESTGHVSSGVDLVGQAGETLGEIVEAVGELSNGVQTIAQSVREQTSVVTTINSSMSGIDRTSQEVSAQFDHVYHTSTSVAGDADKLVSLVGRFKVGNSRDVMAAE